MPYVETRPAASSPEDHAQWEIESKMRGDRKFGDVMARDSRVSLIIQWLAGIGAIFAATGGIWVMATLVGVDKATGILLSRPVPVSKEQYDSDMTQFRHEISTIKADVKDIQTKQAETINRARP